MIAAVNGYALAGGLELALVCDIRIATPNAQFGTPEVKWNLLHGYGAYKLPRIISLSHAMELLLTGEFIDAETALRIGLVSRVVPAGELMPTATQLAGRIRDNGQMAVRMTKELVQRGLTDPLTTTSASCVSTTTGLIPRPTRPRACRHSRRNGHPTTGLEPSARKAGLPR